MNNKNEIEMKFINDRINIDYTTNNKPKAAKISTLYTFRYRVLKTILFHLAYLSLGLNSEIFGVTIEDLKILLNVNYQRVSSLFICKIIGYLTSISLIGLIIDPFLKYSDLLIAIANLFLAIRKYHYKKSYKSYTKYFSYS